MDLIVYALRETLALGADRLCELVSAITYRLSKVRRVISLPGTYASFLPGLAPFPRQWATFQPDALLRAKF